jgi:ABC-type antimicrobial peptide transport system permease subunit
MRLLPWDYGIRNLLRRPLRTVLTALGLTLVVFLLLLVLGFLRSLDDSLRQSGDEQVALIHNIIAADNLENSSISDQLPTLINAELSSLLVNQDGVAALSPELVIATILGDRSEGKIPRSAVLRGIRPEVFLVRRKAFIADGNFPKSGEILAGRLAAVKMGMPADELAVGKTVTIEGNVWTISGHFAAPGTLLEAELWLPLDDLKLQMKRPTDISLVALRLRPEGDRREQMNELEYYCRYRRRDLEIMASSELDYYSSLHRHFQPMRALAWLMAVLIASAGACGAINTMYAAVVGRVREFAALQAVGFRRPAILVSLMQESVLLSAVATLSGVAFAVLVLQGASIRFTMGAFDLRLDRPALLLGCGTGLALGVIGAVPPALRAFRLSIVDALKAV